MDHLHHHAGMSTSDHSSTLAPPHQPPATSGPHSHGGSADMSLMMPMTFYFGYRNVELLFAGLVINSATAMAAAFIAVFLLAMGYEGLKGAREGLRRRTQGGFCTQPSPFLRPDRTCLRTCWQQLLSSGHLVQTALHVLQVVLGYLLMLTTMTYNAYLYLAVVGGASTGYWLFGQKAEDAEYRNLDMMNMEPLHQEGRGSCFTLEERTPPVAPARLSHEALQ